MSMSIQYRKDGAREAAGSRETPGCRPHRPSLLPGPARLSYSGRGCLVSHTDTVKDGPWAGFDVIFEYSREQAIADGVLVDVSGVAREAGIKYPVCVTRAVWQNYVEVPEKLVGLQDVEGRLWDIVWMFRCAAGRGGGSTLEYQLRVMQGQTRTGRPKHELVTLKAVCGPGDDLAPVVTLMQLDES